MGWVIILLGVAGPFEGSMATAQFETEALCREAAKEVQLRLTFGDDESPALVGICFPARVDAE